MTATYWEVERRIVEYEQGGKKRAGYGKALLKQPSLDLNARFGRGFSERNLEQMRLFYTSWPISQTLSAKSKPTKATQIASSDLSHLAQQAEPSARSIQFPLS